MILHPTDDALHDWADGALDPAARPALERHLTQCEACRRQVERLRGLLALAAAAPRAAEPEGDLWPSIRARIAAPAVRPLHSATGEAPPAPGDAAAGAATGSVRRPRGRWSLQLLAAGLAIAAASSALTLWIARDRTVILSGREAAPLTPATTPAATDAAAQYARAADELASAWRSARAPVDPATVAALDESLRAIDQAIAESRRALADTPDDPLLAEIVEAAYRRKVELLRRALELPAWS